MFLDFIRTSPLFEEAGEAVSDAPATPDAFRSFIDDIKDDAVAETNSDEPEEEVEEEVPEGSDEVEDNDDNDEEQIRETEGDDELEESDKAGDSEDEVEEEVEGGLPEGFVVDEEVGEPIVRKSESGERHVYTPEQSAALQENSKFASALRSEVPDITPESARAALRDSNDLQWIVSTLRRGSDSDNANLGKLLMTESGGRIASSLAPQFIDHLKATDQKAFDDIRKPFIDGMAEELYQKAQAAANNPNLSPELREGHRITAEFFNYMMRNESVGLNDFKPSVDQVSQRERELAEREQRIAAKEREESQRNQETFRQSVTKARDEAFFQELDKALERFKDNYPEEILQLVRSSLVAETVEAIKADSDFVNSYRLMFDEAMANPSEDSKNRVTNKYVGRAKSIFNSKLQKKLKSVSAELKRNNQAAHQTHKNANKASHRAPGAAGKAVRKSVQAPDKAFKRPEDFSRHIRQVATAS